MTYIKGVLSMKTEEIIITSKGKGMQRALDTTEAFSLSMGFSKRDSLRTRLLAEETLSMVRSIVEDFEASFWMESLPHCSCELHLLAKADINYHKKQKLIEASTSRRNEASVGIMGKIKDFIEDSIFYTGETFGLTTAAQYSLGMVAYAEIQMWSLQQYRKDIEQMKLEQEDADIDDLLEELERSIIASIADDVRVSVKDNDVEMVIRKNFPMPLTSRDK